MGRFLRSKRLRSALWIAADGKCQMCGRPLPDDWHADHETPWSVRPITNVHEMQALCPECNIKKGATVADRTHQAELRELISRVDASDFPLKILAWVVPGGGKSRLPGILALRFPHHKIGWFVPRKTLQSQAVESLGKDFGIEVRDSGNDIDPTRGTRGFVATHAALMEQPDLWRDEIRRHKYVIAVDECHHAKITRSGEFKPLARALQGLRPDALLLMTGTVETNDNCLIHGLHYDDDDEGFRVNPEESASIYIRYNRRTALSERAIVPIEFLHHDGPVRWKPAGEEEREERLSQAKREDEGSALFTALRTEVAVQLFESGIDHWKNNRGGKIILVADSQGTAKEYAKKLGKMGITTALAIDDNPDAHDQVKRFRRDSNVTALSTCQMAYEGLDAPITSHIICLTHIRSAPWIEQMLARAWRAYPGKTRCWAFVPDDPRMNRVIEKIASEVPDPVSVWEAGGAFNGGGLREPVLALNGNVDSIKNRFLDESFAGGATREKVVEFFRTLGLNGDEPECLALIAKLDRQIHVPQSPQLTVKEQEVHLRNQIAAKCRLINADNARRLGREPRWGEAEKQLVSLTGKQIGDMSIEELKRAFDKLPSLSSR